MIIPENSPLCKRCKEVKSCDCLCHIRDVVSGNHHSILFEEGTFNVKPVKDLDHFRDV